MQDLLPEWTYTYLPIAALGFVGGSSLVLLLAGYKVRDVKLSFISWSHPVAPGGVIPGPTPGGKLRWLPLHVLILVAGGIIGAAVLAALASTPPDRSAEIAQLRTEIDNARKKFEAAVAEGEQTSALKSQVKKLTAERDQLKAQLDKIEAKKRQELIDSLKSGNF